MTKIATGKASACGLLDKFLSQPEIGLFIDGEWRGAHNGGEIDVVRPADGVPFAKIAAATAADIDDAVAAAERASTLWGSLPAPDRAVILHRFADLIDENVEELARLEAMDVGKVVADARGFDIPFSAQAFRYFADLSVHMRVSEPLALKEIEARQVRVPYGACGFIIPWNFPFMLFAWNVAPALAAGNAAVVKPAELTPLSTLLACLLAEEAGIPAGVLNVVPGHGAEAGASLAEHPRIKRIAFTGSPEVGRAVAQAAAANLVPSKLELGGKGAAIVFDDVDVVATADALAGAITLNAGQVCCTATRWFVQRPIFDELVEAASRQLSGLTLGQSLDEEADLGPVVSAAQQKRILDYLDAGRKDGASFILEGGPREPKGSEEGFYVSPALLTGPADNICAREEIFGPVAYVMPFDDEADAVSMVNSSAYGLANSVWSADIGRANDVAERMVAGNSWINAHNVFAYGLPYGGVNLSGFGRGVNSSQTYLDYLRPQTIARPLV
ncbi:MAG: aldehyde dehydrogenase [Thermomicrobiales bacterium]